MRFYFMTLDYLQTMSSQVSDNSSPTELVLVNGDKGEIRRMLDFRWHSGWRLDRIIDHGIPVQGQKLLIYYFIKKY